MLLKQSYRGCPTQALYPGADEETGTAIVTDPQRDVEPYLHDASICRQKSVGGLHAANPRTSTASTDEPVAVRRTRQRGWHINSVFLTCFHADCLAGHIKCRERLDAAIGLGPQTQGAIVFTPVAPGKTLTCGQIQRQILAAPGHLPEAISMLDDFLYQNLLTLPNEILAQPAHGAGLMN